MTDNLNVVFYVKQDNRFPNQHTIFLHLHNVEGNDVAVKGFDTHYEALVMANKANIVLMSEDDLPAAVDQDQHNSNVQN